MMESDPNGLADYLSHGVGHTERGDALVVAWFLEATLNGGPTIQDVCCFLEDHKIRLGIRKNSGRVRTHLRNEPGYSISSEGKVSLSRKKAKELVAEYGRFLGRPRLVAPDRIVPSTLVLGSGKLPNSLAEQINNCFHIHAFDACAVLMRRLMECKIIQLYNRDGRRSEILDQHGEYLGLEKLIRRIEGDQLIKLSRGVPKTMNAVKKLGDRGAHSTTAMVFEQDISDISSDFRAMISELG